MINQQKIPIDIREIGAQFGEILARKLAEIIELEARNKMLEEAIRHLSAELETLKNQKPIID